MGHRSRTTWRRRLALAAILGVVLASDARLAHLASRPALATIGEEAPAPPPCCTPKRTCCVEVAAVAPPMPDLADACGCCRPAGPGDRPAPDDRSTLGLAKARADLGPAPSPAAIAVVPPSRAWGVVQSFLRAVSGRPLYLLNGRFLC